LAKCVLSEIDEEVIEGVEDDATHDSPDDQRPNVEEETDDFCDHRLPIMNLITQTAPVRRTALSRMMKKRMLRPQPTLIIFERVDCSVSTFFLGRFYKATTDPPFILLV